MWESYNMSKQNFVQGEKVVNGLISIELETFRHQSEMRLSSRKMLIIIIQNESNPKLEKSGRSKRSSSFFFSHGGSNAAQIALMAGAMLFGQLYISPNRSYKRKRDQESFLLWKMLSSSQLSNAKFWSRLSWGDFTIDSDHLVLVQGYLTLGRIFS